MNEARFNSIAFDISKRANEKQMKQLIQIMLAKDINALMREASFICNEEIAINDFLE